MQTPASKDALRHAAQVRRSALSGPDWDVENALRTHHLLHALGKPPCTVALYTSRPDEPDTAEAITQLHAAGWQILLPVVSGAPGWALFDGWDSMSRGRRGIPEPATPRLDSSSLEVADVVVVACLSIALDGTRLGTGGGWYDRALASRRGDAPVWALARSQELVEWLPVEAHDVPVNAVITPDGFHACHGSA